MAKNNLDILAAIEIAIEAELKANQFYLDATTKVSNEKGKNLLQQLADFEQNHYEKLKELKTSLQEKSGYIEYSGTDFSPFSVSSEVSGKIETNKDDVLSILNLAIDAEQKASQHYKKMATMTNDPQGKTMFLKLAEEETLHRRILSDEFYQITNKDQFWLWGD